MKGIGSGLSWRPDGSIIAVPQYSARSTRIAFFERNGQQHRDFQLRDVSQADVISELHWNAASDLLAICIQNGDPSRTTVQIFHRNNYHWYIKHEVAFSIKVQKVRWSVDQPYQIRILLNSGEVRNIFSC